MSNETYSFAKDVDQEDWSALPRAFRQGETVTRFHGHTYGLDRDDMMHLGVETIPCQADCKKGFFTVPVSLLVDGDGHHPSGAYIRF